MVSSPYKEGFGVDPRSFTEDGIVSYTSTGTFAGVVGSSLLGLYHATRSAAGWATTALTPPSTTYETFGQTASAESVDLRSSLWVMRRRDPPEVDSDIYLRNSADDFVRIGEGGVTDVDGIRLPIPGVQGTSTDLSHVVFGYGGQGSTIRSMLREYVGTGNGGLPRVVSVDNDGNPIPQNICHDRTSADGRVIVFTSGCGGGTLRLWARVAGTATVAVSGSECSRGAGDPGGVCNALSPATYKGSADDGSRMFFMTDQQLVDGDTDPSSDLYACDIPAGVPVPVGSANRCSSLMEVSGSASRARVESVVKVSGDGSRVYFVAQGVLAGNLGIGESSAVADAHNLYLWERDAAHPAGHVRFVVGLATDDLNSVQMTPDGRYLVFETSNALLPSDTDGPAGGAVGAIDVYRYDSVTGVLVRVSTSVSGDGGSGPGFDADLGGGAIPVLASVTAEGGSIVFDTAEALSPEDTDGVSDVYVWRDGQVSLISDGGGRALWISRSGRDVFFLTDVGLVAGDRDVTADIYDARVGGGFDVPEVRSCSGDECRGEVSGAPGLVAPFMAGPAGGGSAQAVSTLSLGVVSATQRRRFATTGRLVLAIKTNAPGTISVRATGSVGGRSVTVAAARKGVAGAGRVAVLLVLSKAARAQLAARGRLAVTVTVSHSKVALPRSVTLRLTHTKGKTKKARAGESGARRSVISHDRSRS
jgi:hypothetical protein